MIVTLTLGPGVKPQFCFSDAASFEGLPQHRRFIRIIGEPKYRGTYKHWGLTMLLDGQKIERPSQLSVLLREAVVSSNGTLHYVAAYKDHELGIEEPTELAFEVDYSTETFEKLLSVLECSAGELSVSVSVRAPRTDMSGHEGIFELTESSRSWPAEGFYVSRT